MQAGTELLGALHDARRGAGAAAQARAAAALDDLDLKAADSGNEGAALRATAQTLRTAWLGARDGASLERTGLAVAEFTALAAERSALAYDSGADVASLVDETATRLPLALAQIEAAENRAVEAFSSGTPGQSERNAVAGLVAQAVANFQIAADDRRNAVAANPPLDGELRVADSGFDGAVRQLVARLDDFVRGRPSPQASPAALAAAGDAAHRAAGRAFIARFSLLQRILDARASALDVLRTSVIMYSAIGLIGSVGILLFLARLLIYRARRHAANERERARALENELALRRAERANVLNDAQFRAIFQRSPLGIATLDTKGEIVERNPRFTEIVGEHTLTSSAEIAKIARGEHEIFQDERSLRRSNGDEGWIAVSISPVVVEDASIAAIAMVADVTEKRRLADRLRHQATHDALTALPGRALFVDRANAALGARREPMRSTAVMLIDIDRFKLVNDTLGHAAGDRFLIAIGQRLAGAVRPRDLVARFHGDEFAVLLPDVEEYQVSMISERIQQLMRLPLTINGKRLQGGVSIGIAIARPQDTDESAKDAAELLREADAALYRAKAGGRGRGVLFDDQVRASFERKTRLANDLREGIPEGQLVLRYQPIVRLDDERPAAYEVLATWQHPELGEITPSEFVPIAEESDAIVAFGSTVLRQACRRLAQWSHTIAGGAELRLNVNLSGRQVLDPGLLEDVAAAIQESGIAPQRIMFEVTENVLLDGDAVIASRLHALKALGFGLCLDDFGIGYSSLRYVHQFPFDMLKIDRSFVSSDDGSLSNEPIVTMLITLAETLGLQLVAEGIEHADQWHRLRALGCTLGQGFLFGRGLPDPAATDWLRARSRAPLRLVVR